MEKLSKRCLYLGLMLATSLFLASCGTSSDDIAMNTEVPVESGAEPGTDPTALSPDSDPATPSPGSEPSAPPVVSDPVSDSGASVDSGPVADSPSEAAPGPADSAESDLAPVSHDPVPTSPQPPPQSGVLTAGDYDDQLNPWLYQSYSNDYLQNVRPQQDIPRLDLSQRLPIVVTDSNGIPYAGATITLMNEQGNQFGTLITPANGIAYLYKDIDALSDEFNILVEDRFGDVSVERTLTPDENQQQSYSVELPTVSVPNNMLDLQLVIDTTGSMGDELAYLQTELSSIINSVQQAHPQVSIHAGLVVYRDHGDQYVVRSYPFTNDLDDLLNSLNSESFNGGGDYPEAMDEALAEAMRFQWREQSAKVSLLVADAPPHSNKVNATWSSALEARSRQIHIVPVAASGVAEDAEYLMRSMAALTNSRYLFLTDDSGVGNPHEEPRIDCYLVTRLDGLIKRVVDQVVTGTRTEPSDNEVIRQVGNYDNGICHIDSQQQ